MKGSNVSGYIGGTEIEFRSILKFCVNECVRQKTGPDAVLRMYDAYWHLIRSRRRAPDKRLNRYEIEILGVMVEPERNLNGFRTTPVIFANGNKGAPANTIVEALTRLCDVAQPTDDPLEFYRQLMMIHPFADGNGRVGAIIYNWNQLANPDIPPDIFNQ